MSMFVTFTHVFHCNYITMGLQNSVVRDVLSRFEHIFGANQLSSRINSYYEYIFG